MRINGEHPDDSRDRVYEERDVNACISLIDEHAQSIGLPWLALCARIGPATQDKSAMPALRVAAAVASPATKVERTRMSAPADGRDVAIVRTQAPCSKPDSLAARR